VCLGESSTGWSLRNRGRESLGQKENDMGKRPCRWAAAAAWWCLVLAAALTTHPPARAQQPIVPPDAKLEKLFDGGLVLTEGVVVAPDGMVYFSDITFSAASKEKTGK